MRRRHFLALSGTVLLAGCSGDGDGSDGTDTPADTDAPDPQTDSGNGGDETATSDGVEDETGQDIDAGGSGDFQPSVTFDSCNAVTVEAEEPYSAVALGLADGSTQMNDDGYEGTTSFEAEMTINDVVVWREAGGKSNKGNPGLDSCPSPE